jgi:hypothetical protein
MNSEQKPRADLDKTFLNARREASVLVCVFVVFLAWCIGACYLLGYDQPVDQAPPTVAGMPAWVFWGVFAPWVAANIFTFGFALFFMVDDPLGEDDDDIEATDELPGGETND